MGDKTLFVRLVTFMSLITHHLCPKDAVTVSIRFRAPEGKSFIHFCLVSLWAVIISNLRIVFWLCM